MWRWGNFLFPVCPIHWKHSALMMNKLTVVPRWWCCVFNSARLGLPLWNRTEKHIRNDAEQLEWLTEPSPKKQRRLTCSKDSILHVRANIMILSWYRQLNTTKLQQETYYQTDCHLSRVWNGLLMCQMNVSSTNINLHVHSTSCTQQPWRWQQNCGWSNKQIVKWKHWKK